MLKRFKNQLVFGSFMGFVGILLHLSPFGLMLEEKFGLYWLFNLRGAITAPDDAIVVAIDQPSARQLNLPLIPRLWPRDLHARLIEKLTEAGARIIIFDLIFDTPSIGSENDEKLAYAMKKAGNVVLIERLVYQDTGVFIGDNASRQRIDQEGTTSLLPMMADASKAQAHFPLPKVERVNDYWTFKASAGDTPTAPVVVLQIFSLPVYGDFVRLLQAADPVLAAQLPVVTNETDIEDLIFTIRQIFISNPQLASKMQTRLRDHATFSFTEKKLLTALLNLYSSAEKNYLNFYGPPRSIKTVPYDYALQPNESDAKNLSAGIDFKDKVIFVGFSGATQPEQDIVRDDYNTVFSNPDGLFISGVEIAATAFANLLENKPIRPISQLGGAGILLILGFTIGIIFLMLPLRETVASGIFILSIYIFSAHYLFKTAAIWLPVVIPLMLVLIAFIIAEVLKHLAEEKKTKQLEEQLEGLRKSLGSFYPDPTIENILRNQNEQGIYSPCLTTDIAGFTSLAELMDSKSLGQLINDYRGVLRNPIQQHKGHIMDMIGDSMLSIWVDHAENRALRAQACQASLDLAVAVERFNQSRTDRRLLLPTRIGLHFGEMSLRRGDGSYNVIGNIVNTANRIQGANKNLKTQILLSDEMIEGIDDFLIRPLGNFLLPGLTKPVKLFELISDKQSATQEQLWLCDIFTRALNAYQLQRWNEANDCFSEVLKIFPKDGPTQFFLPLCQKYKSELPPTFWPDSSIHSK
jgi:adenylate cyclase